MNESVINFVKVKLLERFDQSWAERLRALRSAKKRIVFEPHYLAMDPIGLRLLSEMLRARQRHPELQIDLLLDFWACRHITPELATLLSARGFRIRYFNCPFFKRISRVNLRSHRKILVIDDEVFIGGLNSSEEFLSQASAKNFMDREVILSGDFAELSAQAIYELGNSSWSSDASEIRWWNFPWLGRQSQRKEAAQILRQIEKVGFEKIQIATASLSLRVEKKNISLVFDHVKGPRSRRERTQTSREFLKLFRETKTRLVWETLFFIVPGCVQRILDHKLKRGLTAQVLTNGRASLGGDFGAAMSLTAFYFQKYLAQGISFFGMKNPSVATHAKTFIFDNHVFMGSLNMDPRSFYTNLESAVIVRNEPEFAAALVASIQKRIESLSQPLGDDGRFLDLPPSKNKIKMTIWQKMTDWILIRIRSIAEPFY